MKKNALIIGGGLLVVLPLINELLGGWDVTLIEKSKFFGAGNKKMVRGILILLDKTFSYTI